MRPRFAGRTNARNGRFATALTASTALLAALLAGPSLHTVFQKEAARRADATVALAVDWDDIRAFVPSETIPLFLQSLRQIPVAVLAVRDDVEAERVTEFRAAGFTMLWKLRDGADSGRFPTRLGPGDGVAVTGEFALESPGMAEAVAAALRLQTGFLAMVEFTPPRALLHLPQLLPDQLLRAHVITTRETVWPRPALWLARVDRAVRDRWVRLVCVRFSSSWTGELNLAFVKDTAARLRSAGYEIGVATPIRPWRMPFASAGLMGLLLAALAPAAAMAALSRPAVRGALAPFTLATIWCAAAGVVAHGLVASPMAAAGAAAARGVKLQLVLPLLLSALVLVRGSEIVDLFHRRVTWGELALVGLFLGGGLMIYLMRSGNDPLLPVSDAERLLRDGLERVLGARPRFKEFAIGHPLLIAGLYLRGRQGGFLLDGRLFILLGVVGQISVVNTFIHAPAPIHESLLRTFNGWWIGALFALPLCHVLSRMKSDKAE